MWVCPENDSAFDGMKNHDGYISDGFLMESQITGGTKYAAKYISSSGRK
jgi:hypothetical protein